MFVFVIKYLTPKGFRGITIFPFVFLSREEDREDPVMLNHERIHIRQQIEMLLLPFFIWYGAEYLLRLLKHKNYHQAYRSISFEREAYSNEKDLHYLKQRSFWNFIKYL